MVLSEFTHIPREEEEGGKERLGFGELSDFEACPGRERVVVQEARDEVAGPSECPSKGREVRHSVFKGGGRRGKTSRPNPLNARAKSEMSDEKSGLERV